MSWKDNVREMRNLATGHADKATQEAARGNHGAAALHRRLSQAAGDDVDSLLDQRGEQS